MNQHLQLAVNCPGSKNSEQAEYENDWELDHPEHLYMHPGALMSDLLSLNPSSLICEEKENSGCTHFLESLDKFKR